MSRIWYPIKGYVAGAVALIFCPCHLPLTLPLLIALTAGTAFSAWLAHNIFLAGAISTVVFIGGLALAFKWTGEAKPPLPDIYAGLPTVTLITSSACGAACRDAMSVWQAVREQHQLKFQEVDIVSPRGRDLAARHNIFSTPAALINDGMVVRGVPTLERALEVMRPHATTEAHPG